MEAVMLIANSPDLLPSFKKTLKSVFPLVFITDIADRDGFVVDPAGRSRIWVEFYGDNLESIGWEASEIEIITSKFQSAHYVYSIAYHNLEQVKKVIISLANNDEVMVANDCGDLLVGSKLVTRILNNPHWNWLQDFQDRD